MAEEIRFEVKEGQLFAIKNSERKLVWMIGEFPNCSIEKFPRVEGSEVVIRMFRTGSANEGRQGLAIDRFPIKEDGSVQIELRKGCEFKPSSFLFFNPSNAHDFWKWTDGIPNWI